MEFIDIAVHELGRIRRCNLLVRHLLADALQKPILHSSSAATTTTTTATIHSSMNPVKTFLRNREPLKIEEFKKIEAAKWRANDLKRINIILGDGGKRKRLNRQIFNNPWKKIRFPCMGVAAKK